MKIKTEYYILYLLLNFQSCLHIGHCCCGWEWSHLTIQWMWKQWEQAPHTNGQSSPGNLQSGQQLSKGIRQMPQLSSFATHRQVATPVQPWRLKYVLSGILTQNINIDIGTVSRLTFNCNFHIIKLTFIK